MSYKSRQKKRAIRAAQAKHADQIKHRWYLTIVKHKTCCATCAGILNVGAEMVYRHTPRAALCTSCGQADPSIKARPSMQWERRRGRRAGA
jgi:hypothetical protein